MKTGTRERGQINLADMMTLMTFFGTPIAVALGASSVRQSWIVAVFVLAGIPLGYCLAYCVRIVAYGILFAGTRSAQKNSQPRLQMHLLTAATLLGYMTVPAAMMFGGLMGVAGLSAWIAKRVL